MAHDARVLVVDDSAAMRALFSQVLDEAKNVAVVGTAADADEAREAIEELRPNVLTLDVEMPGKSGLEFLEEIMEHSPMPVVMLSSLTQAGAQTSLKALELGAVECFAKPLRATPDEFAKTVGKLGKIVHAAANSNVRKGGRAEAGAAAASGPYVANGRILLFSASMGGIEALGDIAALLPANCPPAVFVLQSEPGLVRPALERTAASSLCNIIEAKDGAELLPGTLHIVFDPSRHAIIEAGSPPLLRLIDKDPVGGCRPSADLLYGSAARSGAQCAAAMLTGMGADGAQGLKVLRASGAETLVESPKSARVAEAPSAALAAEPGHQAKDLADLIGAALSVCGSAG